MLRKFKFHSNLTRITPTLREDQYTFLTISHALLLRMRNISDKSFRENQNTVLRSINLFFENRAVSENVHKHCRPWQTTDVSMAHAHYVLDT